MTTIQISENALQAGVISLRDSGALPYAASNGDFRIVRDIVRAVLTKCDVRVTYENATEQSKMP